MDEKRTADRDPFKCKQLPQELNRLTGERGVLPQETLHDGFGRIHRNASLLEYFLKRSGIVIRVAVGENNAVNELRIYVRIFEPLGGIYGRIDHYPRMVQPDDIARGVLRGVETVTRAETGDTKEWWSIGIL